MLIMLKVDPKLMKYFKNHEYGPEIIMVSLYMKGRYSLSYREIEEIGGLRGHRQVKIIIGFMALNKRLENYRI